MINCLARNEDLKLIMFSSKYLHYCYILKLWSVKVIGQHQRLTRLKKYSIIIHNLCTKLSFFSLDHKISTLYLQIVCKICCEEEAQLSLHKLWSCQVWVAENVFITGFTEWVSFQPWFFLIVLTLILRKSGLLALSNEFLK